MFIWLCYQTKIEMPASELLRITSGNSLAPGNFKSIFFKFIIQNSSLSTRCEICLTWMPHKLTNEKSTLVQVMASCLQSTSHYQSQCWARCTSFGRRGLVPPMNTILNHVGSCKPLLEKHAISYIMKTPCLFYGKLDVGSSKLVRPTSIWLYGKLISHVMCALLLEVYDLWVTMHLASNYFMDGVTSRDLWRMQQ